MLKTVWTWISESIRLVAGELAASASRMLAFFRERTANALKRWWLYVPAAIAAAAMGILIPTLSSILLTVVVDDPTAHPVYRALLDFAAASAAIALVMLIPWAAAFLIALPVADLLNRFVDKFQERLALRALES